MCLALRVLKKGVPLVTVWANKKNIKHSKNKTMKNSNTNTSIFKKVGFVLLFSLFAFSNYGVKGQSIYQPLILATSFYNANNSNNLDLHYDFDWNRSGGLAGTNVSFDNSLKRISVFPTNLNTDYYFETTPFIFTQNDTFSYSFRATNASGTSTLKISLVDTATNTITDIRTISITNASSTSGDRISVSGIYRIRFTYRTTGNNSPSLEFSNFTTTTTPTVLPVTYSSLSAKPVANGVKIEWTTTNEENNSHFELERTNDGENWITIGTVEGNGTTYAQSNYEFMDNNPVQGLNVYRLKQVDWNGDYEYSSNKTVVWGGESVKNTVQIFPNPSASTIHVTGVDNPKVTVYNMAGVVMLESENTNSLDLQHLLRGVYYIQVQDAAGEVSRIRFLKD